jgi:hypothetical protein
VEAYGRVLAASSSRLSEARPLFALIVKNRPFRMACVAFLEGWQGDWTLPFCDALYAKFAKTIDL